MQLEHSFTVPVGIEDAWQVLLDIERIAPCMPGAAIDSVTGDDFTGTVKVKLGPVGLTYKGKASFVEKDATEHRAVINAQGRDARGNGTASAKVTATLKSEGGESTRVEVLTDLNITGKPAQFGRGVMVDVGNKLIGQFADCLAGQLSSGSGNSEPAAAGAGAGTSSTEPGPGGLAGAGDVSPAPTASTDAASSTAPVGVVPVAAATEGAAHAAPEPAGSAPSQASHASPAESTGTPRPAVRPQAEPEPIDLLGSAGPAVLKRVAPVAGGLVGVLLLITVIRRLRRR